MRFGNTAFLLLAPCLGILAGFLLGIGGLIEESLIWRGEYGIGFYREFFSRADYVAALVYTHQVAALVAIISTFIGYVLAAFMARSKSGQGILLVMLLLPLLVSVVVRTYGWMVILGPRGLINTALVSLGIIDAPLRLMFSTTGVVIGLVHVFCPFAVLSILAVYLRLDPALREASMALGAGPIRTFFRVTLPLTMPGVIGAITLVYLLTTGAIVTPLLLGGPRHTMLGSLIYNNVFQLFNFPRAAAIALILTASALLVVLPLQWLDSRIRRHMPAARD